MTVEAVSATFQYVSYDLTHKDINHCKKVAKGAGQMVEFSGESLFRSAADLWCRAALIGMGLVVQDDANGLEGGTGPRWIFYERFGQEVGLYRKARLEAVESLRRSASIFEMVEARPGDQPSEGEMRQFLRNTAAAWRADADTEEARVMTITPAVQALVREHSQTEHPSSGELASTLKIVANHVAESCKSVPPGDVCAMREVAERLSEISTDLAKGDERAAGYSVRQLAQKLINVRIPVVRGN